jgi:hypothetical protein
MSLNNLLTRIRAVQSVLSAEGTKVRISQVSVTAMTAEYKQRIFTEGLDSNNTAIGSYSTTPFYQNPNKLVGVPTSALKPEGKTGKTVFASTGKPHKTKYLKTGYRELRELVGRQVEKIDLNFSGSLERSVRVIQEGDVAKLRYTSPKEAEKMEGNEARFSTTISEPTQEELEISRRAARAELQAIFDELDAQ